MVRGTTRTQACDRTNALARLNQAETLVVVAELVLDDDTDVATPGVAAALAILAGIAASDAACCARLGKRPRGQDHKEAVPLLATVRPHGQQMAKDLGRLLQRKDDAHYGLTFVAPGDATSMVGWAKRITADARKVLES